MATAHLPQTAAPALLLEREAELATLEAILDAARSGEGRLVVVEGSAGIGKTRLLAEARKLADVAEFEVLTARGGELEGEFAFGIVRQLFEAPLAAATPSVRADLFSGAAHLSSSLFASVPSTSARDGADSSFAMLHGLYWLVANIALRTPTLLLVDDLHWADESSLRWLVYLAHRLDGLPLVLLAGTRPSAEARSPALVTELVADPAGALIRPAGLGEASAAALARERLGVEPHSAFAAALRTGSGGNPLYLRALLDAIARAGIAPIDERAPEVLELAPQAVSSGVGVRLARLPESVTKLIQAAAILGGPAPVSTAATLAGLDSIAALAAATELVHTDLLRQENPLEFTHPVVRTAVLQNMAVVERVKAHRRAAEILLQSGAALEQVAGHLVQTVPDDDEFVVTTLRRAADRSRAQGAPQAATVYLHRALAEPPSPTARLDVLYELGVAQLSSDAIGATSHLREAVSTLDDVADRPDVVLAYAHSLILANRSREGIDILRTTSDRARDTDRDLHRRLEARLIVSTQYDPEFHQVRTQRLQVVNQEELNSGTGAALLLAQSAYEEARRGLSRADAVERAARGLRIAKLDETDELLFLLNGSFALMLAGEAEQAERSYSAVIAAAQRDGDLLNLAATHLMRGILRVDRGALYAAEEDLRMSEVLDWPDARTERSAYLAEIWLERGDVTRARDIVDVPPTVSADGYRIHFLQARGSVRAATLEPGLALTDFREAGEISTSLGIENPAFAPWRSRSALVLNQLGRKDEAQRLAVEELELARRWGAPRTIGISLRALALVEGGRTGELLLQEAVETLDGSPARLEHARALVDLGAALRRDNRRSDARKLLREGIQLAHECGAAALVERANDELAATGAHRRTIVLSGVDELTASERRVAQMAAEDLSNKEIAQALFVTVKTVEQHLGRVYRKLDLSSRKQLATALGGSAESAAPA